MLHLWKKKMHKLPFTKTSRRAAPLELVHADVCDPTQTPSLSDKIKTYFLLFVDDYSRMMWVYF